MSEIELGMRTVRKHTVCTGPYPYRGQFASLQLRTVTVRVRNRTTVYAEAVYGLIRLTRRGKPDRAGVAPELDRSFPHIPLLIWQIREKDVTTTTPLGESWLRVPARVTSHHAL